MPSQLRGNPPNSPKVKGGEAGTTSTSTNQKCNIIQSFRFLADQLSIRSKLLEHIVPETVKVKVGEAVLTFLRVTNLLSLALSILFSHIQFYLFKLHVLLFM